MLFPAVSLVLAAASLSALVGCFDPRPPAGGACAPGDRCPSPLQCRAGVCVEGGPDEQRDGGAIDGPGPGGGDGGIDLVCPTGYTEISPDVCHRKFPTAMTWAEAEARCEQDSAHLVIPNSAVESKAASNALAGGAWIGVSDRKVEGTYRTVTGRTPPYSGWDGQPPRTDPLDCVFVDPTGVWQEGPCEFDFPFSCEYDGAAADPTAF